VLIYLIRHGQTEWNRERRIMGIGPVPLSDEGRESVEILAAALEGESIPVIYTSVVKRASETAEILSARWGSRIVEEPRLNESPYEGWVGKRYEELSGDKEFELYGTEPTESRFSLNEGMADIQRRALEAVERARSESKDGKAAMVSHSDVIKPIVTHYLGMDLDDMHRLSIANASATLLAPDARSNRVIYLNFAPWKWKP
jgi:broad specificity phosphatase PhoE